MKSKSDTLNRPTKETNYKKIPTIYMLVKYLYSLTNYKFFIYTELYNSLMNQYEHWDKETSLAYYP